MPHSPLCALCWDGADQQLLDWIQLEKERDRQKSPAPAYLVIVYPVRGMAHRENPMPFAATWMDPVQTLGRSPASLPTVVVPCPENSRPGQ